MKSPADTARGFYDVAREHMESARRREARGWPCLAAKAEVRAIYWQEIAAATFRRAVR